MSVSRLEEIYWSDRNNTLEGFKVGSSCFDTSFRLIFLGIEGITVGRFSEYRLESLLSRNDVLSWMFSSTETRSRRKPRQDCRAARELLTPLNRPGNGYEESSVGRRVVLVKFPTVRDVGLDAIHCGIAEFHTKLDGNPLLNRALHHGLHGNENVCPYFPDGWRRLSECQCVN